MYKYAKILKVSEKVELYNGCEMGKFKGKIGIRIPYEYSREVKVRFSREAGFWYFRRQDVKLANTKGELSGTKTTKKQTGTRKRGKRTGRK